MTGRLFLARSRLTLSRTAFSELRSAAVAKTAQLEEAAGPVLKVIEDPELVDRLRGAVDRERNMELLEKEYGVRGVRRGVEAKG